MTTDKTKPVREKRTPFGAPRLKMSVEKQIDGYYLHWFNDEAGVLPKAEKGGYSFVHPSEVDYPSNEEKVFMHVGTFQNGDPKYAYLMKIPLEWHLEDEAEKQKGLDEIDRAIRGGKIEASDASRYVPEGGISIKRK
jgi:hypothetical protein